MLFITHANPWQYHYCNNFIFYFFHQKKKKTKPILKWKKKCATNKKIREFKVKPHFY